MSANPNSRARRTSVGRQGAWLLSGFGAAQACAFFRNAILGHALSMGDFGVAAMLTLMLQVVETLSDLGSDRLIVQAADGGRRRFVAAAHFVLVARGLLLGAILLALGPAVARFFGAPHAAFAFQLMAFAPLIKGFTHLDFRRAQRRFDNRPFMALEALPQMAALALTLPALALAPDFLTVAWLAIAQALVAVVLSHVIARRPYRLIFDLDLLKRHLAFGWPILASALPLIAVYYGDRMIIGRLQGLEAVAGFTAAFMVTMAPGVIAAKVCHALMLPMFSSAQRKGRGFDRSFSEMTELAVAAAAVYLAAFVIAGERLLPIVFGSNYSGLGAVTAWLAAMWSLRIVQAVAGMALMSTGATKPFLIAGVIRAHALPIVLFAALYGASLATLAAIGAAFELLSLLYIAARVETLDRGLGVGFAMRAAFLIPAGALAALAAGGNVMSVEGTAFAVLIVATIVSAAAILVMPRLRANSRIHLARKVARLTSRQPG